MDELVKLVSQKTGMNEQTAKTAVDTVIGFLKQRLPAPVAGEIDALLASQSAMKGAEDVAKNLGGMLNKK